MPLKILACTCGNSANLARNTLKKIKGFPWLEFPVTRGKQKVIKELEAMPDFVKASEQYRALRAMLTHKSKFVVFFGYSTENQAVIWADVASGKLQEKIDAELIAEKYEKLP